MDYLSGSARELADYLGKAVLTQLELSIQSGRQYREDADYIGHSMESFNDRALRLKTAMDEIAGSISGISGAAGSTRGLVDDMAGITARMETNREIVGELQKQMEVFSNL